MDAAKRKADQEAATASGKAVAGGPRGGKGATAKGGAKSQKGADAKQNGVTKQPAQVGHYDFY